MRREVGAGATGTRGTPEAALSREVGIRVATTHGGPRATLRREASTTPSPPLLPRGAPGAALRWEVSTGAMGTCGTPEAALSQEVGAGAAATRGGPRATLSREVGTTPPPPLLRPFVGGQDVVVPVTPPDDPYRMITWGKTGFRVVLDHLVLTVATSSPTPSSIPSSAHAALVDPHWRAAMEEEYRALISNGTWELVP
jgi:hypothetical protein